MDFFGPQGPSSVETQGLLTSITLLAQEKAKKKTAKIEIIFFMFWLIFKRWVWKKSKCLLEFFNK